MPYVAFMSKRTLMICAWTDTSSNETGSSHTTNSGVAALEHQGDGDTLALAAAHLVGITIGQAPG